MTSSITRALRRSRAALVTVAIATGGCSIEQLAMRQTVSLLARTKPAMAMESDVDLARAATPPGLKQLEGIYLVVGPQPKLVKLLTEAFCGYAAGFVQDDWEAAVLRGARDEAEVLRRHVRSMAARCAAYALVQLGGRHNDLLSLDDEQAEVRLAAAGRGDASGLTWLATAIVTAIGVDPGDPRLGMLVPRATAILERVVAVAPGAENGQAELMLGALLAAQSASVGGDPERGRALLEDVHARTRGRSLLPRVLLARIYAVTVRDEALFTRLLVEVLRTPPSIDPDQRLANELAHRKARRYLAARRRYF